MRNGLDASFKPQVFRKSHKHVLASNRQLATIFPVRLAYDADGYEPGQVLSHNTVDDVYEKFSAASGTYPAVAVLFDDISGPASSGTALARGIFGGEVLKAQLVDYDATAKSNLGAKDLVPSHGTEIVKF